LNAFSADADRSFEYLKALGSESESLAELRDTLLPKLMSGELRVKDAERIVEDAT
jgi:type I restriction enzyme S subunit